PIFLAYLFILPGMAVFLVSMEADFAEQHERFYRAVREGDTLMHIEHRRDRMVYAARQGIYEIFKVQGLTVVLCLLWGRELLHVVGISPLYIHLFYIDVVAVSVQVLLMDTQRTFLSGCPPRSPDHYGMLLYHESDIYLCNIAPGGRDFRLRICHFGDAVRLSQPVYPIAQVQSSGV